MASVTKIRCLQQEIKQLETNFANEKKKMYAKIKKLERDNATQKESLKKNCRLLSITKSRIKSLDKNDIDYNQLIKNKNGEIKILKQKNWELESKLFDQQDLNILIMHLSSLLDKEIKISKILLAEQYVICK